MNNEYEMVDKQCLEPENLVSYGSIFVFTINLFEKSNWEYLTNDSGLKSLILRKTAIFK